MPKPERAGDRGEGKLVRTGRDRPIIMSAPMVRALLAGTKTQTRRIVGRPTDHFHGSYTHLHQEGGRFVWSDGSDHPECLRAAKLPYAAGDRLWVKEACGRRPASFLGIEATNGVEEAFYRADEEDVLNEHEFNFCPWWKGPTLSPIHMPRWASRLTLIVEAVKVERLQDISEVDAIDEGALRFDLLTEGPPTERGKPPLGQSPKVRFAALWRSIHGSDAWNANPWVCAISFRCVRNNIDALGSAA